MLGIDAGAALGAAARAAGPRLSYPRPDRRSEAPLLLSWNEIRDRAVALVREWAGERSEHAEAEPFWDGFWRVFGLKRHKIAQFEEPVRLVRGGGKIANGYIDLFWKDHLIE